MNYLEMFLIEKSTSFVNMKEYMKKKKEKKEQEAKNMKPYLSHFGWQEKFKKDEEDRS